MDTYLPRMRLSTILGLSVWQSGIQPESEVPAAGARESPVLWERRAGPETSCGRAGGHPPQRISQTEHTEIHWRYQETGGEGEGF